MSEQMHRDKIARLSEDKAKLDKQVARESDKLAKVRRDMARLAREISSTRSAQTARSKQRQIESKEKDAARLQRKIADLERKVAAKETALASARQRLDRAVTQRRRREAADTKRRRAEEARHQQQMTREAERRAQIQPPPLRLEIVQALPEEITVTLFAANPLDQPQLRLDEEVRLITEKMRAARYRDSVHLSSHWAVRTDDLLQALNEDGPTIVHFSGHGSETDICFQRPDGATKTVSKEAITQIIASAAENIRMIVFNTCYSSGQAEQVVEHVDLAIGMSTAIGDEAARVFAGQFYSAIGFGRSVKEAYDQARAALMAEGIPEQDTPELYCRTGIDPAQVVLVRPPDAVVLDVQDRDAS